MTKRIFKKTIFYLISPFFDEKTKKNIEVDWFIEDECEKEIMKLELNSDFMEEKEKEKKKLEIMKKYRKINEREYQDKIFELEYHNLPEKERKLKELEMKRMRGEIDETQYLKEKYTIEGKPWFNIKETNFNPDELSFELEFDWNKEFIDLLKSIGFSGKEEDMVDFWFFTVCRAALNEENLDAYPFTISEKTFENIENPRITKEEDIGDTFKKYE